MNLIGEHTDYNDGFALPFALPQRVICAAAARSDGRVEVRSRQRPNRVLSTVAELATEVAAGWAAYPLGVVWAFREAGYDVRGADLLLDGAVPLGAGLASSAALGCAVALALNDLGGFGIDRTGLALLAQRAENGFVGAPTGLMDQLAALHCRPGHLLFLDARTPEYSHVPVDLAAAGLTLLVIDTRTSHRLAANAYADRRKECAEAARQLGVESLREATTWAALPAPLDRRARHVITENARVLATVTALRRGDFGAVGPLLTASHDSLRADFEVSVPQLDVAVAAAVGAGAQGARMTGGGFGGCVIALVDAVSVERVRAAVEEAFAARGFDPAKAFVAVPSGGAQRIG